MESKKMIWVLVVEDIPDLSDTYRMHLEKAGFYVDIAESRLAAIEAVKAKYYDVALVDLQLKDEISHDGGLHVLDVINQLREGTKAIVVSATSDIDNSTKSWRRGIVEYLRKGSFQAAELIAAVNKALEGSHRNTQGDYPSVTAYLATPDITPIWEDQIKLSLQTELQAVQKVIWKAMRTMLPLLRLKDGSPSLAGEPGQPEMHGMFWSKAIGKAIWVSIANGIANPEPEGHLEKVVEAESRGVTAVIWAIDRPRDQFLERLDDLPGQT